MRQGAFRLTPVISGALASAFVVLACGSSGTSDGQGGSGAAAGVGGSSSGASGGTGAAAGASADGSGGTAASSASGGGGQAATGTGGAGAKGSGGSGGSSAGAAGTATDGGSANAGSAGAAANGSGAGGSARGGNGAGGSGIAGTGTGGSATAGSGSGSGGTGGSGGLTGAMPSPGCGKSAPMTGARSIDVSGTMRDYILRLPDGYDATKPYRIIFAFHGMQGSAEQVDKGDPPNEGLDPTGPYYGIRELSSDTIFVAGQALSGGWTNSNGRDIAYVKALLASLEGELCIDESRVLATGFSFGAIMTITVACNMADVFRAVAPMSGSLQNGCPASDHSIAYWASHGTMDTTIEISKGEAARDEFVKRNHCGSMTAATTPEGCVSYQGCAEGYPVTWCPFEGIHQPPPFSGPAIWAFLSSF